GLPYLLRKGLANRLFKGLDLRSGGSRVQVVEDFRLVLPKPPLQPSPRSPDAGRPAGGFLAVEQLDGPAHGVSFRRGAAFLAAGSLLLLRPGVFRQAEAGKKPGSLKTWPDYDFPRSRSSNQHPLTCKRGSRQWASISWLVQPA